VSATTGARGAIDQDIFFLESVVSVHDQGLWVADLDVLKLLDDYLPNRRSYSIITGKTCDCPENTAAGESTYTSVDTWDELLDLPESIAVFRARENLVARLAAVSILRQKNEGNNIIVLGGSKICWSCIQEDIELGMELPGDTVIID